MRIQAWLSQTITLFQQAGIETAALDARLLLGEVCGLTAAQVLAGPDQPIGAAQLHRLDALRRRRVAREPVSRLLGRRAFMDLELEISPATLDPRPDTETLVEAAVQLMRDEGRTVAPLSIADLGTGSGAILIALLRALPSATGLGIDISRAALDVARRNAQRAGVADRCRLREGGWLTGVAETFDLIVANPPYIPTGELASLAPEVVLHDPPAALDGGTDGLDAYRAIVADLARVSEPGGWSIFEVGTGQADAVAALLSGTSAARAGVPEPSPRLFKDLAGHVRCVAKKHRN